MGPLVVKSLRAVSRRGVFLRRRRLSDRTSQPTHPHIVIFSLCLLRRERETAASGGLLWWDTPRRRHGGAPSARGREGAVADAATSPRGPATTSRAACQATALARRPSQQQPSEFAARLAAPSSTERLRRRDANALERGGGGGGRRRGAGAALRVEPLRRPMEGAVATGNSDCACAWRSTCTSAKGAGE